MKGFPDLPPIWWAASMAAIYLIDWVSPGFGAFLPGQMLLSWALLAGAIALILLSALWFLRKKTPIEPHHTPKALIIEGPFRISRNPIYLALVMITLGAALSRGSLPGLVIAGALWWVLDRRFAAKEETLLVETFGAEAEAYLATTRRWL